MYFRRLTKILTYEVRRTSYERRTMDDVSWGHQSLTNSTEKKNQNDVQSNTFINVTMVGEEFEYLGMYWKLTSG